MPLLRPSVIKQHSHMDSLLKYGQSSYVAVKLPFHPADNAHHLTGHYMY